MTALAPTLQSFFTDYLVGQRGASPDTIAAYRDTFRLLLRYLHDDYRIAPADIDIADLTSEVIAGFLVMLEQVRNNSTRTRNARLAAIHSLFKHAALCHPEHADTIARVLAIPKKAAASSQITYLSDIEVDALLGAPDRRTWTGRRDHTLMLIMVTTGVRVSEITGLTRTDTCVKRPGAHIACHGKGRKSRVTPLADNTASALGEWLTENTGEPTSPVFTVRGARRKMSTDAVAQRIGLHAATAARHCPTLTDRNITPHVLRHTCAMRMLASGIDSTTIALWLGHASPESTRPYLHADMRLKQSALDRTAPPHTAPGRYKPPDRLLAFLEAL